MGAANPRRWVTGVEVLGSRNAQLWGRGSVQTVITACGKRQDRDPTQAYRCVSLHQAHKLRDPWEQWPCSVPRQPSSEGSWVYLLGGVAVSFTTERTNTPALPLCEQTLIFPQIYILCVVVIWDSKLAPRSRILGKNNMFFK